jgi:hypothetical protein
MPPGDIAAEAFARLLRGYGSSVSGVAVRGATPVTAVLADRGRYTGTVVHGAGFPYPVWPVSYPINESATLVSRNAAGDQVAALLLAV